MAIAVTGATTDNLFINNMPAAGTTFTWMCWFYFYNLASGDSLFGRGGTNKVYVNASSQLYWYGPNFTSNALSTNTWYHLAFTKNGNTHRIFVDGVQDATTSASSSVNAYQSLGYYNGGMDGRMEAWKVWSAELVIGEVQKEQWFNMPQRTANLDQWLPFTTPDPANFRDYSGNGRNMTEYGTVNQGTPGPPISFRRGRMREFIEVPAAGGGRIMSSCVGSGGLAGKGGIAGIGGGLAG